MQRIYPVNIGDREHVRLGLAPSPRIGQIVDAPVLADAEPGDLAAVPLEVLAGVDDRLVLGHAGDDVVALGLQELDGAVADPLKKQAREAGRKSGAVAGGEFASAMKKATAGITIAAVGLFAKDGSTTGNK